MKAIILIAGVGKRLRGTTDNPKCLLKVNGIPLLERYLRSLASLDVKDIALVVGYKKEKIIEFVKNLDLPVKVLFMENPDFTRGSILSLNRARDLLKGDIVLMDGDVFFDREILGKLIQGKAGNFIAIDTTSKSTGEEVMAGVRNGRILEMSRDLSTTYDMMGEVVGFYRFDDRACTELKVVMEEQLKLGKRDVGYEDIFSFLFQRLEVKPVVIDGLKWTEIDFESDLRLAETLAKEIGR
jgi:choline kinase